MRDMLDDLRRDLGIPAEDHEPDGAALRSMQTWSPEELAMATRTIQPQESPAVRGSRRKDPLMMTQKTLPALKARRGSSEGKPPLPRPGSRGSRSRPGSSCSKSDLHEVKEVNEEAVNGVADILTINHNDAKEVNDEEPTVTDVGDPVLEDEDGLGDTLKAELLDYEEDFQEDEEKSESPPQPTPRKRSVTTPRSDLKETPRSNGLTQTTDSITVSELDENESPF
jgi:hypothetical protein